jgi:hypothetical protein
MIAQIAMRPISPSIGIAGVVVIAVATGVVAIPEPAQMGSAEAAAPVTEAAAHVAAAEAAAMASTSTTASTRQSVGGTQVLFCQLTLFPADYIAVNAGGAQRGVPEPPLHKVRGHALEGCYPCRNPFGIAEVLIRDEIGGQDEGSSISMTSGNPLSLRPSRPTVRSAMTRSATV